MEAENKLTPLQSLELISEVISKTKENIKAHSFAFLVWGWALSLASFIRFYLETQTNFRYYFIPFPILVAVALGLTVYKGKVKTSETYLSHFLKVLWFALAIGFIASVFISLYEKIEPFAFTLLLAGIGTAVSGIVMKFRPLVAGSVCFFLSAIICLFVADEYKVLIHGFAIIIGYLIPGYLLKNSNA